MLGPFYFVGYATERLEPIDKELDCVALAYELRRPGELGYLQSTLVGAVNGDVIEVVSISGARHDLVLAHLAPDEIDHAYAKRRCDPEFARLKWLDVFDLEGEAPVVVDLEGLGQLFAGQQPVTEGDDLNVSRRCPLIIDDTTGDGNHVDLPCARD